MRIAEGTRHKAQGTGVAVSPPARRYSWCLRWVAVLAGLSLLSSGCSGVARVYVIPAAHDRIEAAGPLLTSYDLSDGWFWVNETDELCVVLSRQNLADPGSPRWEAFDLSLVLGRLPAGLGRNYQVDQHTLRAAIHEGNTHRRFGSLYGTVGVWYGEDEDILHGRFRIFTKEQTYKFWRGWGGNGRALLVGEFTARRNPDRGRELLPRTDSGGLKRQPQAGTPVPVQGPPIDEAT